MKYLLIIEKAAQNLSAYFPDIPGCVTAGTTVEEAKRKAQEALELHLGDGQELPMAFSLEQHLRDDLELTGSEYITWVNYESAKTGA